MSQYCIGGVMFDSSYLAHAAVNRSSGRREGYTWANHKYIRKEGDRYIYPEDLKGLSRRGGRIQNPRITNDASSWNTNHRNKRNLVAMNMVSGRSHEIRPRSYNHPWDGLRGHRAGEALGRADAAVVRGVTNFVENPARYVVPAAERAGNAVRSTLTNVGTRISDGAQWAIRELPNRAAEALGNGRIAVQSMVSRAGSAITDIYKLGTGAYVREAQAAYDRNPSPENMNALREAQSRYDNSIFGRVRSMITRAMAAVRGAVSSASDAVRRIANPDRKRGTSNDYSGRSGSTTTYGYNGRRAMYENRAAEVASSRKRGDSKDYAGQSGSTTTYGYNRRRRMYENRAADVASARTRPRR